MLEVGDRLLSAFGQDTIDALFWTATEPKKDKQEHLGVLMHIIFAFIYVILHSFLIMFQATTLNVAVNSNNKGLLTIMISNNFVELKGSVFKKFDKNNLFQLSCSDVRERFHISVLLFIVMIQTMKEFEWSFQHFVILLPDCFAVLITEILIDWVKHAFITRFNELHECIYREYTTSLAYDMTQTRQKHAFSDHSDLVARRMGFIPFPLSVVLAKAVYSAVSFNNAATFVLFGLVYVFVLGLRLCVTICALGQACKLMKEHQDEKCNSAPSSMTNGPPVGGPPSVRISPNVTIVTPPGSHTKPRHVDAATTPRRPPNCAVSTANTGLSFSVDAPAVSTPSSNFPPSDVELDLKNSLNLGATALFSNSDVDLDDVCLNEKILEIAGESSEEVLEEHLRHSEPDLSVQPLEESASSDSSRLPTDSTTNSGLAQERPVRVPKRTHRRSESEPGIQHHLSEHDTKS